MPRLLKASKDFILKHQDGLFVCVLVFVTFLLINHAHVASFERYFISDQTAGNHPEVALVLGGGIENGRPRPILKGRLDKAASLFENGKISSILVSGDNRSDDYNEPGVMRDYLVQDRLVPTEIIQEDFAGRSTYESCERAKKIFGLDSVLLVSEETHLPRAIYLCRSFGLEAYGAPSNAEVAKGLRLGQRWREFLASQKAFINVHIKGENTLLGEEIALP